MQIAIAALVLVLGAGAFWFLNSDEEVATNRNEQAETVAIADTDANTEKSIEEENNQTEENTNSSYEDGTYSQTGTYISPAGKEDIEISLTLENGVVTEATFNGLATNPGSIKNQAKFAEGFEAEVVGKPLDEISLDVVNGSSLTPKGFMDAVAKIKTEANQS